MNNTTQPCTLEEALQFERIASLKVLKLDEDLRLANEEIAHLRATILMAIDKLNTIGKQ